ncbi:alpha/beta fold hydrolase [Streptomyces sp. NPDC003077]|uniref:PHA/PHB synthase family protein n=1 Tax=Streptomyces sp. NPDC003077 TaxID=3154443 RepID=UPI0033A66D83
MTSTPHPFFTADDRELLARPGTHLSRTARQAALAARWFATSLAPVRQGLADHWPQAVHAVLRAAGDSATAASSTLAYGVDHPSATLAVPDKGDRRFRDEAWRTHRYFHLLQQLYLLGDRLAHDLVDVANLSGRERHRAHLAVQFLMEALSPTNTVPGNPEVLRQAVRSRGASLVRGVRTALADLAHHHGRPRQVEPSAFTVGRDLATTPGRVVLRTPLMELIQYQPQTPTVHAVPLVISPPWINKYYVLDLAPGRSLVEWAVRNGHTVFCPSYRNPDRDLGRVTLGDFMCEGLLTACRVTQEITGSPQVNLLGVCNGGTLAVMLQAWLAAGKDDTIRSTTLLNTYIDFADKGVWGALCDEATIADAERLTGERGRIDGHALALLFDLLRGKDLFWHHFVRTWLMGERPPAFDLLSWNNDVTDIPADAHHEYVHDLFLGNKLAAGTLTTEGRLLRLDHCHEDVFVVAAQNDHLVPWWSAYQGARRLAGDVRFILSSGGHVAGVVNPPCPKAAHWSLPGPLPSDSDQWLASARHHRLSWWQAWADWLAERSGDRISPPPMGNDRYPAGDPAPGRYARR